MKFCCFGDEYTHTYAAACEMLRRDGVSIEPKFFATIYDTLAAVKNGLFDAAVVPIENSVEGTVTATCDALSSLGLYIVREAVLPIRQNLIVREDVELGDVSKVYSHPQALAQCRETLRKLLPQAELEAVAYTSAGLGKIDGHSAAIAREPLDGQVILCEGIEDSGENCTRFIEVRREPESTGDKVSVVFSTPDRAGALVEALNMLAKHGVNMTKIESRPAKRRLGQYIFYLDFAVSEDPSDILGELSAHTDGMRLLGRYPAWRD